MLKNKQQQQKLGMLACVCNPNTEQAETKGSCTHMCIHIHKQKHSMNEAMPCTSPLAVCFFSSLTCIINSYLFLCHNIIQNVVASNNNKQVFSHCSWRLVISGALSWMLLGPDSVLRCQSRDQERSLSPASWIELEGLVSHCCIHSGSPPLVGILYFITWTFPWGR